MILFGIIAIFGVALLILAVYLYIKRKHNAVSFLSLLVGVIALVFAVITYQGTLDNTPVDSSLLIRPTVIAGVGETFTDDADISWQVLYMRSDGTRLVITEHVHGRGTRYHHTNEFVPLRQAEIQSNLEDFWDKMGADMRTIAIPVNLGSDFRTTYIGEPSAAEMLPLDNNGRGFSTPAAGAANRNNAIFLLTLAEVSYYFNFTSNDFWEVQENSEAIARCIVDRPSNWWLRSPGVFRETAALGVLSGSVMIIHTGGARFANFISNYTPTGFRPALWLRP